MMSSFDSSVTGFRRNIFGRINKLGVLNFGNTKRKQEGNMPNDPIIIGIAVIAIAVLGYTAISGMMNSGKSGKDKTNKGA